MIDADCNLQLQTVFDRLPKANIQKTQEYSVPFDKNELEDTEQV